MDLRGVGLWGDLLRDLPVSEVRSVEFVRDPLTADAPLAFIARQPHVRDVTVRDCPSATGDGPARIAAALAGRDAQR